MPNATIIRGYSPTDTKFEPVYTDGSNALRVSVTAIASYSVGVLTVLANNGTAWTEIAPGAVKEMIVRPQDPTHTLKVGSSAAPGTAYELVPAGDFFQHPCTASVWIQLSASGNVSVRKYS